MIMDYTLIDARKMLFWLYSQTPRWLPSRFADDPHACVRMFATIDGTLYEFIVPLSPLHEGYAAAIENAVSVAAGALGYTVQDLYDIFVAL